jgi:hypothetical protein
MAQHCHAKTFGFKRFERYGCPYHSSEPSMRHFPCLIPLSQPSKAMHPFASELINTGLTGRRLWDLEWAPLLPRLYKGPEYHP